MAGPVWCSLSPVIHPGQQRLACSADSGRLQEECSLRLQVRFGADLDLLRRGQEGSSCYPAQRQLSRSPGAAAGRSGLVQLRSSVSADSDRLPGMVASRLHRCYATLP